MFALIDANSFYCSAEQVFRPQWRGRPIIVLSNNDGCIVAANKQAIALGIKKFQPYFKAKLLCEKMGIIVCSSNYELYADLSSKMMQVIGRFAPLQHVYSIDESFLTFDRCSSIHCLVQHAQKIRKAVWKETRLPVCVGLGPTLTLAKLANHIAKKWPDYQGVCLLDNPQIREQLFKQLAPADVWGIGRRTSKKLSTLGINNVSKLMRLNTHEIRQNFNVELMRTIKELNGEVCKGWDQTRADKQQIFSTRSVGQRIIEITTLQQALAKHTAIAAVKARQQGSLCGTLMAFAASSPFDKQPRSFKIIKHFTQATNNTLDLLMAINNNIDSLFQPGIQYYKVGIGLFNLSSEKHQQFELFSEPKSDDRVMKVLDNINQKYGTDSVLLASQGIDEKWAMRRQFLTPQYTTKWHDIPKIHC
ncbi:DNA polymerase V subunit UmuC [Psychromonas sp. MB-3u-54]|uniref:Y-family DNA polymerase n=1 Tax=Psychromonas sp. MB-3u-54 TaxID=2058319 RepID=UPI000C348574|nr:Y-family DNA polymerase [Psychromonas sp. MB-3u-54]PKH02023.1 DNA polymerase V subunit UmuC [Psychromonas sp. MB-3u-54]